LQQSSFIDTLLKLQQIARKF